MRLAPQAPPNKVNQTVTVLFTERLIDMTEKTVKIFPNMYFGLTHCYDEVPDNNDFKLHNHDDVYEIVLFLSGDLRRGKCVQIKALRYAHNASV